MAAPACQVRTIDGWRGGLPRERVTFEVVAQNEYGYALDGVGFVVRVLPISVKVLNLLGWACSGLALAASYG